MKCLSSIFIISASVLTLAVGSKVMGPEAPLYSWTAAGPVIFAPRMRCLNRGLLSLAKSLRGVKAQGRDTLGLDGVSGLVGVFKVKPRLVVSPAGWKLSRTAHRLHTLFRQGGIVLGFCHPVDS